jgi:hypothetical protein
VSVLSGNPKLVLLHKKHRRSESTIKSYGGLAPPFFLRGRVRADFATVPEEGDFITLLDKGSRMPLARSFFEGKILLRRRPHDAMRYERKL